MGAMLTAFGLIFLAELGDKSMLFSLAAATRLRWWVVLLPVAASTALLMALAVAVGGVAGEVLPDWLVALVAAVLFVGFGVWALLGDDDDDEAGEAPVARGSVLRVMAALFAVFFVAEFGDKTQIATMSLAGLESASAVWVWAGATAGMLATNGLAIAAGARLSGWLEQRPEARRWVRMAAGLVFVGFGILAAVLVFL